MALELLILRANDPARKTFGKLLSQHGSINDWIARSRIEIDAGRLLVLNAADQIDRSNAKGALKDISMAKIYVPSMALVVIDRAIQAHGAAGVCQDFPLARMWAMMRTLRIADGPDEVHLFQLGRIENQRYNDLFVDPRALRLLYRYMMLTISQAHHIRRAQGAGREPAQAARTPAPRRAGPAVQAVDCLFVCVCLFPDTCILSIKLNVTLDHAALGRPAPGHKHGLGQ